MIDTNPAAKDILALTEKLYGLASRQIASAQHVSQEDIAIVNRARIQIRRSQESLGAPYHQQEQTS